MPFSSTDHDHTMCSETIHLGVINGVPTVSWGCGFHVCFVWQNGKWIHISDSGVNPPAVWRSQLTLRQLADE